MTRCSAASPSPRQTRPSTPSAGDAEQRSTTRVASVPARPASCATARAAATNLLPERFGSVGAGCIGSARFARRAHSGRSSRRTPRSRAPCGVRSARCRRACGAASPYPVARQANADQSASTFRPGACTDSTQGQRHSKSQRGRAGRRCENRHGPAPAPGPPRRTRGRSGCQSQRCPHPYRLGLWRGGRARRQGVHDRPGHLLRRRHI